MQKYVLVEARELNNAEIEQKKKYFLNRYDVKEESCGTESYLEDAVIY